jgi:signal transduction histidine kinase
MSRIFEPFFTTAREKGGSGLGLSLVFNLVQQKLKGVVTCDSTLGEGVCFTVDIPNNIEHSEVNIPHNFQI